MLALLLVHNFERMMICKLINIEMTKRVIRIVRSDFWRHKISIVDRDEMRRTENGIYVNDSGVGPFTPSKTGVNHPHPSDLICCISNVIKPMDDGTAVEFSMSPEREETEDASNVHTAHSIKLRVSNNEYTVIAGTILSPSWRGTNIFALHASNTTKIAWSIERQ